MQFPQLQITPVLNNPWVTFYQHIQVILNPLARLQVVDGLVNHFHRMLQNGEFWLRFDFVKSPPDGHCIIHSLKTCLNSYKPNCTTTYDLLEMLSLECVTRSARYLPCYYVGDISECYQELEQYVRYKKYDTRFCDIVLDIMSNVLKRIIFVIDKSDVGLNVYAVNPCDHNQITDTTLSDELDMDFIVLYREGGHYDACVKVYPCRSKTISVSLSIENDNWLRCGLCRNGVSALWIKGPRSFP